MTFVLDPVWSWLRILITLSLLVGLVLLTYPQRIRHLSRTKRWTLLGFRLLTILLLFVAMLRPSLAKQEEKEEKRVLLILADGSESMLTEDGPAGISRREAVLKTLAESASVLESVREQLDVRYFDFAGTLTHVTEYELEAPGKQTDIGKVLTELRKLLQPHEQTIGIVMLSDGAVRTVSHRGPDPLDLAERIGRENRIPIYTIGFGSETVKETGKDVAVEELTLDPLVYVKNVVPVSARIRIAGAAGRKLTVRLLVEDRKGVPVGMSGEMKVPPLAGQTIPSLQIETRKNNDLIPVELSWLPTQSGSFKVALEVVPIDGEIRTNNNRAQSIVKVQKGGLNIAYFDRIRPEQKFLRHINSSEKIQVDFFSVRYGGKAFPQTEIPENLFDRERYDVYIIGDVPASVFGTSILKKLAERIDEGTGLLMTGGVHSFGRGKYHNTPLERYLPVLLSPFEKDYLENLQMIPTRSGLNEYVMRLDSPARNEAAWKELAPMQGANILRAKNPAVRILAQSNPGGFPLLFSHEVGPARVMVFAGDTTYQWYLAGQHVSHQRFWQQLVLWLAHKEDDTDSLVWSHVNPTTFGAEETVPLEFGAQTEEKVPVLNGQFHFEITRPDKTVVRHQRMGVEARNLFELKEALQPGDYHVRVRGEKDSKSLGPDAWVRFLVEHRDLERDHPASDLALLKSLSQISGGIAMPPEQLGPFLKQKVNDLNSLSHTRLYPLWDNWGLLLGFALLISTEWYFRKKFGLV